MPKFKVETPSSLSAKEAFGKIRNFMENTDDLKKIDSNIECKFEEAKLRGTAKGKQFKADISVVENSPQCVVSIEVEIPLLLSPLKGKIQETLERKIKKALA
ncbi:MAG: hypothetical protein RJB66_2176 [Pseudomonadota bacterium]|jgi:hypothetical protein